MNALKRLSLYGYSLAFLGVLLVVPNSILAHLDPPPSGSAVLETVWLTDVNVIDDMDHWGGGGELSLEFLVRQPKHTSHIPLPAATLPAGGGTVSVSAPPATPFPGTFPKLLHNQLNCTPLERITVYATMKDADVITHDVSMLGFAFGEPGFFRTTNGEFGYGVFYLATPVPDFDDLCQSPTTIPGGQQPAPPLPPQPPTEQDLAMLAEDGLGTLVQAQTGRTFPVHLLNDDTVASFVIGGVLALIIVGFLRRRRG
jgi:hypothetical protein